jgi:hypothetical protein
VLANMLIPGRRSQGLVVTCVIGVAGRWAAAGRPPGCSTSKPWPGSSTCPPGSPPARRQPSCSWPATWSPAGRPPDGAPVTRLAGPDQPGQPARGARRGMRAGAGIFFITAGAVLRFAFAVGSPPGLNVHIVGVILMLAGVAGLLLPRLARGPLRPGRLRRWIRPGQPPRLGRATDRHDRRRLRRAPGAGPGPQHRRRPPAAGRRSRRLGESPAARRHCGTPLSSYLPAPSQPAERKSSTRAGVAHVR